MSARRCSWCRCLAAALALAPLNDIVRLQRSASSFRPAGPPQSSPSHVPEFDLAFMSQMLGVGAVRSEPEDPATGDDETIMQEAAVDVALQLDIASDPCFSRCFVARSARHLTLRSPAMASTPRLSETRGTIQLRSKGSNALSLRRNKTTQILHASLRRWLD